MLTGSFYTIAVTFLSKIVVSYFLPDSNQEVLTSVLRAPKHLTCIFFPITASVFRLFFLFLHLIFKKK